MGIAVGWEPGWQPCRNAKANIRSRSPRASRLATLILSNNKATVSPRFFRVEPNTRSPDPLSYNIALQWVPCARVAVIVPPCAGCEPVAEIVAPHLIIAAAYKLVDDELEPLDSTSLEPTAWTELRT